MKEEKDYDNVIFGIHPVIEALEAEKNIDKILMINTLRSHSAKYITQIAKDRKISLNRVPLEKLQRITRANHQGVIAFTSPIEFNSLEVELAKIERSGEAPLILVLDRVNDVRNFGAIIRTAECAGVHTIVIPKKGAASINPETVKTSAGAIFNISICKEAGIDNALELIKSKGIHMVACTEKTDKEYYEADFTGPTAIVMGSEESGIAISNIKKCHESARIPLFGKTESLNVSVAAGIILYEAVRQRIHM
jgi:23S rRNA (guanosine2251-2'-O)-methyltransferase